MRPSLFQRVPRSIVPPSAIAVASIVLLALVLRSDVPVHAKGQTSTTSTMTTGEGYAYGSVTSSDDPGGKFSYAILDRGTHAAIALSDMDRIEEIDALQKEAEASGVGLFWFSLDGRSYRVLDRGLVSRAREIAAPMIAIGQEQGKQGEELGRSGEKLGEFGALQGRIGELQGRLARRSVGANGRERAELESMRREVRELSEEMRALRRSPRGVAARHGELSRRQGELGKLGRKQARASKQAMTELRALAERAVAEGKAERVRP